MSRNNNRSGSDGATGAGLRLTRRDWLRNDALQSVFDVLEGARGTARIAGGAVRNAVLDCPINDIDIATTLRPAQVQSAFKKAGLKSVATGIAHGTVTVVVDDEQGTQSFEVTTLRVDTETHGRHATVAFTNDWAADAARRDFTMNALYCDREGALFDPLGGYDDLVGRRVVFVGDASKRIEEDYLRILRFFRIHAVYGQGALDETGLAACLSHVDGLAGLSAERVRQEMWKLLVARRAVEVVRELHDNGILARILGSCGDLARFERLVAMETAAGLAPDPLLRVAALSLSRPEDVAALRDRLVLTNVEAARLTRVAGERERAGWTIEDAVARRMLYRLGPRGYRDAVLFDLSAEDAVGCLTRSAAMLALPERWRVPLFSLSGRDVVAQGVPPGQKVGRILDVLEAEWIASDFTLNEAVLAARLAELVDTV